MADDERGASIGMRWRRGIFAGFYYGALSGRAVEERRRVFWRALRFSIFHGGRMRTLHRE